MSFTGGGINSREREAWHEAGHATIAEFLCGVPTKISLSKNGAAAQTISPIKQDPPKGANDWLPIVAYNFGGRGAVHRAIERGYLPRQGVHETTPGDHGFLGKENADEAYVWKHAAEARGDSARSTSEIYAHCWQLALHCIDQNFEATKRLADALLAAPDRELSADQVTALLKPTAAPAASIDGTEEKPSPR